MDLFPDVDLETVFIPIDPAGRSLYEVPKFAYALAPADWPAHVKGIPAKPVHVSRRDVLECYSGAGPDDRFVWLASQPYEGRCWKIDLSEIDAKNVRLYDRDQGHLIHRGSLPPRAVAGALNLPALMELHKGDEVEKTAVAEKQTDLPGSMREVKAIADRINDLLKDLAKLPIAGDIIVFGPVAHGQRWPKQLNICVDLRSTWSPGVRRLAVNDDNNRSLEAILNLADSPKYRGLLRAVVFYRDAFMVAQPSSKGSGWKQINPPSEIQAAIKQGRRLSEIGYIDLDERKLQILPKLIEQQGYDEEGYMSEGCGYFALALSEELGYPLAALVDEADLWDEDTGQPSVAHVFAVRANRAIDIKGVRTLDEVRADFPDLQEPRIYHLSRQDLLDLMGEADNKPLYPYDPGEVAAAKEIVREQRRRFLIA